MNFSKYLCCRKNKNICSNIITSSLTVQVTFILPLTVINLREARIPLVTFEKKHWSFGAFKQSLEGHAVTYCQSLAWIQNSSPFIDSTKICSLRIHCIQSQDSLGTWNAVINRILFFFKSLREKNTGKPIITELYEECTGAPGS